LKCSELQLVVKCIKFAKNFCWGVSYKFIIRIHYPQNETQPCLIKHKHFVHHWFEAMNKYIRISTQQSSCKSCYKLHNIIILCDSNRFILNYILFRFLIQEIMISFADYLKLD